MRKVKNFLAACVRVLALAACGMISVFLLAAGYEAVFNRSLPAVHTIDPVNISAMQGSYDIAAAADAQKKHLGNFGKPQTMKMPERSARFNIADPIRHDSAWLSRANAMHLLLPVPARAGNIGVTLLYCRSGFRTINSSNLPANGSNIFIDTDQEWRYVFKVTSAKAFPADLPYIASDTGSTGKLVIICNDGQQRANMIIEANLLSVQGVAS